MAPRVPVTIVNHVAIDIARPPDPVWATIVETYAKGRKFSDIGYTIEPLDEPSAYLGGYWMRFEQDGAVVDERLCRVTELDDASRRLSMAADYLCVPGGMTVYASYHAQADRGGTRLAIDCHSSLSLEAPADGCGPAVKAAVAAMTEQYGAALAAYLASVKSTLERQG
jgi:hypothetical protein